MGLRGGGEELTRHFRPMKGRHGERKDICGFFLRKGACKFGEKCKYSHELDNFGPKYPIRSFTSGGLPIRPGERICGVYIKSGSCPYGMCCKFNHLIPQRWNNHPKSPLSPVSRNSHIAPRRYGNNNNHHYGNQNQDIHSNPVLHQAPFSHHPNESVSDNHSGSSDSVRSENGKQMARYDYQQNECHTQNSENTGISKDNTTSCTANDSPRSDIDYMINSSGGESETIHIFSQGCLSSREEGAEHCQIGIFRERGKIADCCSSEKIANSLIGTYVVESSSSGSEQMQQYQESVGDRFEPQWICYGDRYNCCWPHIPSPWYPPGVPNKLMQMKLERSLSPEPLRPVTRAAFLLKTERQEKDIAIDNGAVHFNDVKKFNCTISSINDLKSPPSECSTYLDQVILE